VTGQGSIMATASKSVFRRECAVTADIAATPERTWQLLTDADDMVRWNSTLTSMGGTIGPGGTVEMEFAEAPGTVFKIKVTTFTPPRKMVWTQGNPIMFRGVRTYRLTPLGAGRTKFEMIGGFLGPRATDGGGAAARLQTDHRAIRGRSQSGGRAGALTP
jgi:uncharacterized protein YndB with AHSA1/START domain